ncbi:MAG: CotH kinase family protein [Crocinitomicaceae bacterium]
MLRCLLISIYISFSFLSLSQTEGNMFFASPSVHEIRFTFHQTNYWDSLLAGYSGDYYIACDVEIDGQMYLDCGVKMKGNSSYNNPSNKKSFKIDFNEYTAGQNCDGLKKLNLNNCFKDPTFLREKLMLDFLNQIGAYAPRCHYSNLYINNQLWGFYTAVDEIDKTWLNRTFGDDQGNLFKGDPSGDLKWLGSSQSLYTSKYELKTNETANNWSDLINFINTLNNSNISTLNQNLDTIFDAENYMKTWASHILFANLDSYIGSGHNFYLYYDSLATKFRFITWDVNEAFGNFKMGQSITQLEQMAINFAPPPMGNRPLTEKLVQNTTYYDLYKTVICGLLQNEFSIWSMEAHIDELANLIRPHVYADPNKFFTNQNFEDNIDNDINVPNTPGGGNLAGLKSFITDRRQALATQVSSFCTVGLNETSLASQIFPNPTENKIIFNSEFASSYTLTDASGKVVQIGDIQKGTNTIDLNELKGGIYFISVAKFNVIRISKI